MKNFEKMNPWNSNLHKRNFISTCGTVEETPMDRIRLVPPNVQFTRFGTDFMSRRWLYQRPRLRKRLAAACAVVLAVLIIVLLVVLLRGSSPPPRRAPDPLEALPASRSVLRTFARGAVCTDGPPCSAIGRDVLEKNGSAVDAAIAAMFCNGIVNMQSMGIGGGFLMTVYIKAERNAYTVVAREKAPGKATDDMYEHDSKAASKGPLAAGVPGEVRGMWEAHRRWGVLPWADLIEPSLDLCRHGYNISIAQHDGILVAPYIKNDGNLRRMFFDEKENRFKHETELVMPSRALCRTLEKLAENGGDDFYNGTLAQEIVADLQQAGSIITRADLMLYQAKVTDPVTVPLPDGTILYSVPPPSSGVLLGFILNILAGYNFTSESIHGINNTVLTYHRMIEAFKYAYAKRTKLGDADFVDIKELIHNLTRPEYASKIRAKINDNKTSDNPTDYGAEFFNQPDAGTAHISIIAPNGDAVSVTSSVNYYFGAGWTTRKTGILMNNVMDDFSSKSFHNSFELPGSPANKIEPYKRPMSSMSPTIIVDKDGDVRMVIGASGGTKITTAMALVVARHLWLGQDIKQAIDAPRFHHQIFPMKVEYEFGNLAGVVEGLRAKGHTMQRYTSRGSIICALSRDNDTIIFANADFRKGGDVFGID